MSRRARLTPESAGVPQFAGQRRVPGLRREEVAFLAGVSTDYYARIERGNATDASPEVLNAIARALQLDDTEHQYLLDLAAGTQPSKLQSDLSVRTTVSIGTQAVLDALTFPAFVQNRCLDFVAANPLGRALYGLDDGADAALFNAARFQYLQPAAAAAFYRDFDRARRNTVALLREGTVHSSTDARLTGLITELQTLSPDFAQMWAKHDVIRYQRGAKRYHHHVVGDVEFGYESFALTTDPGLTMLVYTVEPESATARALSVLVSMETASTPPHLAAWTDLS